MDPRLQLRFDQWRKKMEGFLHAGETFKEEETLSMYAMLPSAWHGIMPDEKRKMMTVIDMYGGVFSVDLCKALITECSIPFKEIHQMLMCYDLAKKHMDHLDMTLSTINNQHE
jgi:hypothetical protein